MAEPTSNLARARVAAPKPPVVRELVMHETPWGCTSEDAPPCAVCGAGFDISAKYWSGIDEHTYNTDRAPADHQLRAEATSPHGWLHFCSGKCLTAAHPEYEQRYQPGRDQDAFPPFPWEPDYWDLCTECGPVTDQAPPHEQDPPVTLAWAPTAALAGVVRWCRTRLVGTGHE